MPLLCRRFSGVCTRHCLTLLVLCTHKFQQSLSSFLFMATNLLALQLATSACQSSSVESQGQPTRRQLPSILQGSLSSPAPSTHGMPKPWLYHDSVWSQVSWVTLFHTYFSYQLFICKSVFSIPNLNNSSPSMRRHKWSLLQQRFTFPPTPDTLTGFICQSPCAKHCCN